MYGKTIPYNPRQRKSWLPSRGGFQDVRPLEHMADAFPQSVVIELERRLAYDADDVDARLHFRFHPADDLFHAPPHPVANDGIADLLAYGHAEAERFRRLGMPHVYDELVVGGRFAVFEHLREIFSFS